MRLEKHYKNLKSEVGLVFVHLLGPIPMQKLGGYKDFNNEDLKKWIRNDMNVCLREIRSGLSK